MEHDLDRRIDLIQDPCPRQRFHEKVAEMLEAPSEVHDLLVDHAFGLDRSGLNEATEYPGSPACARAMGLGEPDQFAIFGQDAAFVNEPTSFRVGSWHLGAGNEERIFDDRNLWWTGANPDLSQSLVERDHQILKPMKREVTGGEGSEF